MPDAPHLPAEICFQILDDVCDDTSTAWQKYSALCNIRLVNRAWCHFASVALFQHITLDGSRCVKNDIGWVSRLERLSQMSVAGLVSSVVVHISLYDDDYDDDNTHGQDDGDSASLQESLFARLSQVLPRSIPCFPQLEGLHLLLLDRERLLDSHSVNVPLVDALRLIEKKVLREYFTAIGRCLSLSHLPRLNALSLDLSTICDLSPLLDTGDEAPEDSSETRSFFAQNISQLRHLSLTVNNTICRGCLRPEHCDYHHRFPVSFPYSWACVPHPLMRFFSYGLEDLESLTILCTDLHRVYIDMHEVWTTAPFTKLRHIDLHKVLISFRTLVSILDTARGSLQEICIHWVMRIPRRQTKAVTAKLTSMPWLEWAIIVTMANTICYKRREVPDLKISAAHGPGPWWGEEEEEEEEE
ncbi:uncharacterized protein BJX67DRAFT_382293 [Aspergillus lucknowensis]|uniref:F-box domain-containing protein n=1 Tax=Aspergillus lucknowensis TaxID=176173 RepID=A0ABR4LND0_9EURO